MKPQRFLILVQEHNLWKGRSFCSFTGSLKLHTLLAKQPLATHGLPESHWCCVLMSVSLMPAESRVTWPLNLRSPWKLWAKKIPQYFWTQARSAEAFESSHCCWDTLKLAIMLLTGVLVCLWAAGLWLSKTLNSIEQLQPQQPSQPSFSSQDQEPLPGELWPRELGLMNCFSIQIWHHISLLSPWLSPSLAPVLTFILLILPIPRRKRIWEWGTEEGESWSPSAPFGIASPPQIWQQQMSKARVLVNIRCCRFVLVLVSFLWLQLLHF